MYTVLKLVHDNPNSLAVELNDLYKKDRLELVAVDNGYYIFKPAGRK